MKVRLGFVSNSSSTSFTINNGNKQDILNALEEIYSEFKQNIEDKVINTEYFTDYTLNYYKNSKSILDILSVFEINIKNRQETCATINDMTYYGFKVNQFKKGQVWIVSNSENTIHYDLIEMIEKHFKVNSRHLG
jgi:hypothetical protein